MLYRNQFVFIVNLFKLVVIDILGLVRDCRFRVILFFRSAVYFWFVISLSFYVILTIMFSIHSFITKRPASLFLVSRSLCNDLYSLIDIVLVFV